MHSLMQGKMASYIKILFRYIFSNLGITSSNIDVYRSFSLGNWKKLCIIDIENNPYSSKHFEQNRR